MLKSIFSFMLIGTLLFSSNPIANIMANKATDDEARSQSVDLEEVFVSESGMLADAEDGEYVGIPAKAFEPGQTFEEITVNGSNKMKDVDGEEIGTYSDQLTGKVSEEELAAPRALTHLRGTNDSAQQSIEINDFRAVVRSGAVRNADGDYVWTAPNSDHAFTYRIIYSFSGEGEYDRGQIQMTIPKTILRDRSGEYADVFDVAVPEENEGGLTDQNLFVYRVEGDKIVIYNRIGCVAAQNGFIEVSYKTSKSTFDYADYKSTTSANTNPKAGSDPFQASIEINRGDEHLSGESASVPVYIDTTAKLNSLNKNAPDSAYSSWSAAWGDAVKPANPGDYEYLVWTVRTEASCTQPYNLIYEDTFNQDDAMLLGYSVNKSDFSSSLTRTNIRSNYETAYVLTAHKKSAYNALLDSEGRYKIDNAIKVTLVPFDEVDGSSMRNASASYVKEAAHFTPPSGHFYAYKYGYDVSDRIVYSSDQIRDYSLIEFNWDSGATIGDLKYYADVYGYSYPWTLQDGVDAATVASDPEAYYGQIPVTYRLSDNTFYLKEISDEEYSDKLTAADYELEYIQMYIYEEAATYNDDTKQFNVRTLNSYSQSDIDNHYDIIEIYAEVGGSGGYKKVADYSLSTKQYTYTEDAEEIVDKTKTSGMNVYFEGNVTGYRLETTNAYWYTKLGAYPYAKLKHSDTVDSYVKKAIGEDSVSKLCLKNQADSEILSQNSKILGFTREGVDYITGKVKSSELRKSYAGSTNSKKKREYTVTWDTSVSENYSDNDGSHAIPQQSGVFYDLLPDGAAFKKDSLYVYASGAALEAWKYTVNVDENYKGSGRTLLTIRINESGNNYRFRYSTVHSWNSITDFGNNLLNTVAYETGNASIAKGKTTADTSGITEKELMKNLDPSAGDAKRFLYTQAAHTADIILAANLGLEKTVRSSDNASYSRTAQVYSGGSYSYNVRFATDDASKAKNLIAFDSLENHTVVSGADSGRSSDWHGTLKSVDTHQLTDMGIAPKVYYSTVDKLNIEQHHELSETSVWTLSDSFTGDLSTVKAIAVDMRKATDGSDFVLPEDKAVQFTIHMTAPKGVNNDSLLPKAYNNIYLNNILIDVTNDNEHSEELIHQDYTEVLLKIAADLELLKVSRDNHAVVAPGIKFSLNGESDYGTSVDEILSTDENGRITRNNLEKGTYTLVEEDTTADFFKNDTRFTVIVDNKGKVTINGSEDTAPYKIEDPPRVHGRLDLMKKGKIDGETQTKQLIGAQFTIEGDSYYGNHIVLTEESKDGGIVSFPDIERGTYELTETRAANGYITTKEKYRLVCDRYGVVTLEHFENEAWAEVTDIENGYPVILNEPLHSLRLVKYDEVNNKLLGGAEFRLTGTSAYGTYVDITKETETSGSYEGTVLFDGLEPGDQYTLKETKAPDHYQLDDTLRTVTISPEGEVTVTGLTKMPSDWQGGYYADCFGVPNTRAYEGEITITKRWLDADGRRITDSSDLPIPVVHVDTSEPKIDLPPQDAYLSNSYKFRNALSGATTFQKTTEQLTLNLVKAKDGVVKVDDGRTRASIYVWKDGTDAYWWTNAVKAHLPNNSSYLFSNTVLNSVDLRGFDTSNVTDMNHMFNWCSSLTSLDLGDHFDTGNVTDMSYMFYWCNSLTSLDLGDKFDTGNVENMSYMFSWCISLTTLDLGDKFDTGNVNDMSYMFYYCPSLTTLDLGDNFDTGKVTDMKYMFDQCWSLTSLNLGDKFDTGNVTDMSYMFYYCRALTSLDLGDKFDTGNVTDMSYMFYYCSSLTSLDLGDKFDTGNVTDMSYIFYNCSSLTTLDLGDKFDTGNVTDMSYMFYGCSSLTSLDLGDKFDTGNVTGMSHMFCSCNKLTTLDLGDKFDTGSVRNMSYMFNGCSSLTSLNLGDQFDTGNVTNMSDMFNCCTKLTTLDLGDKFDTGNVTSMSYMFYWCISLTSLDLGDKFDTGNVISMGSMFSGCRSLTSLDLSSFNTGSVTGMSEMFSGCHSLTTLDLSSFNTGSVTDMSKMFSGCSSLETVYVSERWSTVKVTSSTDMFSSCSSSLTGGAETHWNSNNPTDKTYARIDNPPDEPGYFTYKANILVEDTDNAYLFYGNPLADSLSGATSLQKTTEQLTLDQVKAKNNVKKVDDGTTRASIYMWKEGTDLYWWTDAATAHLPNDSSNLFKGNTTLTNVDLSGFDTSNVTNMNSMFGNCTALTTLDLSSFYTGNVENMNSMFYGCSSLETVYVSECWSTARVAYSGDMFSSCSSSLTGGAETHWNSNNPTDKTYARIDDPSNNEPGYFTYKANILEEDTDNAYLLYSNRLIDFLSGATSFQKTTEQLTLDQVKAKNNVKKVDDGTTRASIYMWKEDTNAYWWTDAATAHLPNNSSSLFSSKETLTDVDLSGFDTSNVTNMYGMFYYCPSLTSLDLGDKFDTGNVNDMSHMFYNCSSLTTLDLSSFDTGNVTDMSYMFYKCSSLTTLDLGDKFDTGNVTNMSYMFFECRALTTLDLGDKFDTGNVTDMQFMFYGCSSLTTLDLGDKFDTGNVTSMYGMFWNCSRLTSLDLGDHFDTGKVTDMSDMFTGCSSLTSLDLSSFNTRKVTKMYSMFYGCRSLTTLDLSSFNTGSVTIMNDMFSYCSSLTTLDLSSFNTGNVTSMSEMFSYCSSLKTVYVSKRWSTANVTSSTRMFVNCSSKLAGGAGTHWNSYNPTDKTYARIDDPSNNKPGYFTYKAYVPPTGNKDDEPVGATLNNVLGGLINKLVSAVFGDSSAENSQAAPEIKTVKKPKMLSAGTPIVPAALQLKSDGALGAGDGTDTNTVTFSQTTNSVLTHDSDDTVGKWYDNGDGTWTYKMKVFDADAKYYVWEEPIPGFKCDLVEGTGTGYTVINYPSQNHATITNTRTTTNTCSLTLKKVLEGNASDYPEYDLAGMDYHFNVKLTGEGVAGEKVFGLTKFNNGEATVTLKAGEQMTFTNIPRGVEYSVTEQEENYQGVIDTTYSRSGTLTEDKSDVTFTVTNTIKDKKSLNIKKTVLSYDGGELDDEDRARVFTFNVDLHADINGLYGELIFSGGKATAYLKHDETVSITGLPDTVGSYTVTEAESALYTCDQPTQSGELIGKETSIEFKNTKIPEEERYTGSFTLKKLINGKTTTDNEFAFNIAMSKLDKNAVYTLSNGTSFTSDINGSANLTIQLAHDESVKFSDLPVGAEYTVSEQACNYTASYAITGTERVVPLTAENTETDKQLTTSKITVQKDDDITITYTNTDKRYDVFIAKVIEVEKGYELLEGAELQIIEKDNESNVIETWTTTDEQHKSEVPQGTYILREVTAPFGYMKAPDIVFTVDDQGHVFLEGSTDETAELKMVDKPVELAVTGAGGVIPVAVSASISFVILLAAVVIKNRKNNIKEKRSTTK